MSNNRRRGHDFERWWKRKFTAIGYKNCKTTREASRLLDACGVDLAFLPYNVQCKFVKSNINYSELFREIKDRLKKNLPKENEEINKPVIIIHKRGRRIEDHQVILEHSTAIMLFEKAFQYDQLNKKC